MSTLLQKQFSALPSLPKDNTNGLVAWLAFDGSLIDGSGRQNNGANVGSPKPAPGPFGKPAISIDGSNYPTIPATVPNSAALFNIANTGTWSGWFKSTTSGTVALIGCYFSASNLFMIYSQPGTFGVYGKDSSSTTYNTTNTSANPQDGNWHHLVGVWDQPANKVIAYIDGIASSAGTFAVTHVVNNATITVGFASDATWTSMVGSVADIRLYNRALSPGEVTALYRGAIAFPSASSEGDMPTLLPAVSAINASGSQTLAGITQSATAALPVSASGAQTLANVTQATTATITVTASGAQTLGNVTQTAAASLIVASSGSQSLDSVTQTATASVVSSAINASGAQTLGNVTQSAAASVPVSASGSATLDSVTQSGTVMVPDGAQGTEPLDGVSQSAAATVIIGAVGVQTLGNIVQVAKADFFIAQRVYELFGTISRSLNISGGITRDLPISGSIPRKENRG